MLPIRVRTDAAADDLIQAKMIEGLGELEALLQMKLEDRMLLPLVEETIQLNDVAYVIGQIHGLRRALVILTKERAEA